MPAAVANFTPTFLSRVVNTIEPLGDCGRNSERPFKTIGSLACRAPKRILASSALSLITSHEPNTSPLSHSFIDCFGSRLKSLDAGSLADLPILTKVLGLPRVARRHTPMPLGTYQHRLRQQERPYCDFYYV
jgi:hypothetical protein